MKEKNKKILKGLAVGSLALVGMVGLTGCANISNTDYDRIMDSVEVVENSISNVDAAIIYNNAMNKIINTSSDFWNSMKVDITKTYVQAGKEFSWNSELYMLKEYGEYVALTKNIGETDTFENNEYEVVYSQGEKVFFIDKEIDGFYKSEQEDTFFDCFLNSGFLDDLYVGTVTNEEFKFNDFSDVVGAIKNEQGNYVVTTIVRRVYSEFGHTEINSYIIENEIDSEYNLISQKINATVIDGDHTLTYTHINTYTYGTVEYEDIQEEFELLKNYEEPTPKI